MEWRFEHIFDGVSALHALGTPDPPTRLVRWCDPLNSALVLGSAQPLATVDQDVAADLGVEIVRRRSGGGAVLVEPSDIVWVDVFVPAGDPLWQLDVGRAFWWLGDVWAATLEDLGYRGPTVHRGGLVPSPWSQTICFAGLGPGEVTVGEAKAVGLSQKRTRAGALFQCSLIRKLPIERMLSLLALDDAEKSAALDYLISWVWSDSEIDAHGLVDTLNSNLLSL